MNSNEFYYQVYAGGMKAAKDFNIDSYPTNIIIDPHGKIVYHKIGYNPAIACQLDNQIEKLLKQHFSADMR